MDECIVEKTEALNEMVSYSRALTGDKEKNRQLYYQLKQSLKKAENIDIMVSFLMESGVRMLMHELSVAIARGAKIRILTGSYLGITQPSALYLLREAFGNRIEMRLYKEKNSFHPKVYFFHYGETHEMYIGSSNISRSALTSGIEWNYRLERNRDEEAYAVFFETFLQLYQNHSIVLDDGELKRYSENWHQPMVMKDIVRDKESDEENQNLVPLFQPRGAQIEALYALNRIREDGATKALVQAATGIGKTYLAAFDSKSYERVLFVAHREEILKQAAQSFQNVRGSSDVGYFSGTQKDTIQSMIFASVATLGQAKYLTTEYFAKEYFDYIVVDEFHHAVNDSYCRILEYFEPKFMLGLTATPERMDGRSIYGICDYNVAFELSLFDAINKGMLVPFHYYGVYDDTDYTDIKKHGGRYAETDLNRKYIGNGQRVEIIVKHYNKYQSQRAIGFCATREHAEMMAREFSERNIPAVAVYSNSNSEYAEERSRAIEMLKQVAVRVIFVVDMFNEGTDIPELDMVMFLRPTESPTIFLQQLGRGLRLHREKEYLNVLDFIGNYEKAGMITGLLAHGHGANRGGSHSKGRQTYPDGCMVDFDIRLIDLFEQMEKAKKNVHERIVDEFYRIQEYLGHVPSRMELMNEMDSDIYEICITTSRENLFKHYLDFLQEEDLLSSEEQCLYHSLARDFLHEIEMTNMVKVYKMPVLMSFYNHGNMRRKVTDEQVLEDWKQFFDQDGNWKDFKPGITYEEYKKITDKQHINKIRTMPINHLRSMFFIEEEGYALTISEELQPFLPNETFIKHYRDIVKYRIMDYYRRRYENQRK